VCTVLDSWWWTENLSKTCRVLFQKFIWEISASRWFYYKNVSRCTVLWMSDPLDSQLPVLQLVHLGISPVFSVSRWTSLIHLQPCLHTAYSFGHTSCHCYLLQVPSLTALNSNCNSSSNFWPLFFISLGKELIALSLPMFQANNLDHFLIWNQPVIFILQSFMFL
jgi:hypothetical protein